LNYPDCYWPERDFGRRLAGDNPKLYRQQVLRRTSAGL